MGLASAPHPPKTHRASGWPAQSPGSKVRGKVSFVPSVPLVLNDTHPRSHVNPRTLAHANINAPTRVHAHRSLLEGGSDFSLCARPTRKWCSTLGVFDDVEAPPWKRWLVALSWRHVCSSKAVQRLVTDSNNNQ